MLVPLATPVALQNPIILCDSGTPAILSEDFNLLANFPFGVINPLDFNFTYHTSLTNAQNNVGAITTNLSAYSSNSTSIWVRIVSKVSNSILSCAKYVEQPLKVNPLPLAGPISKLYSCKNPNSTQAVFNLNDRIIEALAGQNPLNFSVTFHLLQDDAKTGANPLTLSYSSISKTIYASVKNIATGCRKTASLELVAETTSTATQPNADLTFKCDTDTENDGFTSFKLSELDLTILGNSQPTPIYSVNYYVNQEDLDNNIPINKLIEYKNITNPQTIIANVVNTSSNVVPKKCAAQIYIVLKVNKLPVTNPEDGFVCFDQNSGNLLSTYTIESDLNDADYTFEWFLNTSTAPILGETASTLTVSDAGNYSVIATQRDYPNCKSLVKEVKVTKSEPAKAIARVEYSFTENLNVITIATGLGNYIYQLDDNDVQTSNLFENVEPGTHRITVYDKNGCDPFELSVIVLDYDRFFTPNTDGYNDKWNIKGIKDQPNAKVFIFDRYGKFIKQIIPGQEGWNGTYAGSLLPSDDYWFTVNYEENGEQKEFKSHFTMKR